MKKNNNRNNSIFKIDKVFRVLVILTIITLGLFTAYNLISNDLAIDVINWFYNYIFFYIPAGNFVLVETLTNILIYTLLGILTYATVNRYRTHFVLDETKIQQRKKYIGGEKIAVYLLIAITLSIYGEFLKLFGKDRIASSSVIFKHALPGFILGFIIYNIVYALIKIRREKKELNKKTRKNEVRNFNRRYHERKRKEQESKKLKENKNIKLKNIQKRNMRKDRTNKNNESQNKKRD